MAEQQIQAGERLADLSSFSQRGGQGPNLWRTLGFRRTGWGPGTAVVEWDATVDYGFYTASGPVIQGGLVTAILDSAMRGVMGPHSPEAGVPRCCCRRGQPMRSAAARRM